MGKLEDALNQIEKQHGKGTIMRLGDKTSYDLPVFSSGILPLDIASGIGGYPKGRIIEIFGPESGGKTTVTLHAIAEAQRAGGVCAFIDAEHALDPNYAKHLGVNLDDLLISQPDNGEQGLEVVDALVNSGQVALIVVDSVAALVPKAELEGEMGDSHVGLQPRLMSQAMRKLNGAISKTNTIVIFINQIREKVGVMYGSPEVTTGGRALKFYASMRIDIRKGEPLKKGTDQIGVEIKAKFVKNKLSPPFKVAVFDLIFGDGVPKENCLIDVAVEKSVIVKSGAWYKYGENNIGQGKEQTRQYLKANPEIYQQIEDAVLGRCGG